MHTTTVQINGSYPPDITNEFTTSTVCATSVQNLHIDATETTGKYVEVVLENEQLKAEIARLKARLAELGQE